jgi:hypothetical protein
MNVQPWGHDPSFGYTHIVYRPSILLIDTVACYASKFRKETLGESVYRIHSDLFLIVVVDDSSAGSDDKAKEVLNGGKVERR